MIVSLENELNLGGSTLPVWRGLEATISRVWRVVGTLWEAGELLLIAFSRMEASQSTRYGQSEP